MSKKEEVSSQSYLIGREQEPLQAVLRHSLEGYSIKFILPVSEPCLLHWGLSKRAGGVWTKPPKHCWPEGTESFDELAIRTPFVPKGDLHSELTIHLPDPLVWCSLEFVLYFPESGVYFKNRRYDFNFPLPCIWAPTISPEEALQKFIHGEGMRKVIELDSGHELAICRVKTDNGFKVAMACNEELPLFLHWGLSGPFNTGWFLPEKKYWPKGTLGYDEKAVRTPFIEKEKLAYLDLDFPSGGVEEPEGVQFLLYQPSENLWLKHNNNDLSVSLFRKKFDAPFEDEELVLMLQTVVGEEVGRSSWTLMHRYHLACDMLDSYGTKKGALEAIFVWLRYSAIRQLDWQRHYNTKPRDLAGAQRRLTDTLARLYIENPANRQWLRLIMQTVGRGGEGGQGQQIRDEILNIMHRHHIKEVKGIFMEEWHQKLHNNTTPDDISICLAYIAYLESNGRLDVFYEVLEKNGVTKERMANYDRAIVTEPNFYADKKDGLIHDFYNYLKILKAVHGGAELEDAFHRVQGRLDGGMRSRVEGVLGCESCIPEIIHIRQDLAPRIENEKDYSALLDYLYFDIALEDTSRRMFEALGQNADYYSLLVHAIEGCELGDYPCELELCRRQWLMLLNRRNDDKIWNLEALANIERIGRIVQERAADVSGLLQPLAEFLGKHFACAEWTVKLFAEEVVRGGAGFPVSKLVTALSSKVREASGMGGWQVISPGEVTAKVLTVEALHAVQEEVYQEPVILLSTIAGGDEEPPQGAVGIVTRVAPDLVSHLSVRARNLGVVFCACFEDDIFEKLQANEGKTITFRTLPSGKAEFFEADTISADNKSASSQQFDCSGVHAREFTSWAVGAKDFTREILGGKSNNLNLLRGKVSPWIKLPASMAVPFGACEKTLGENPVIEKRLNELLELAQKQPSVYLPKMREEVLTLNEPVGFKEAFLEIYNSDERFGDCEWEFIWKAVKKVWASKWNERAFLSRRNLGLAHDKLQMAVLVQQVVRADYAFVIHTVNPLSGDKDEVFAEVVLGLGETLVGNYPGRSLGFTCRKSDLAINILTMPGKSLGLYGGGVIFRSDSNGEDLEGFAGAGLYDSYLAQDPVERELDYTDEKIMRDAGFRDDLLRKIGRIAIEVENICGSAQDIEGAVEDGEFYVVQNRPQVGNML